MRTFATASRRRHWLIRICVVAALGSPAVTMFLPVVPEAIGAAGIGMMLVLMFLKVPVGVALAVPGALGLYAMLGERAAANALGSLPYEEVAEWSLSVLPMFVFMGLLLWRSGTTEKMYLAARRRLRWLPGGLAIGTNIAGAGLAAVSGSTISTTYALARIGIPEMLKAGYDRRLVLGSVLMAGIPGQLIPPSILLIIYAGIAEVPVGPQLIAGVGPGIAVALSYCVIIAVVAGTVPKIVGHQRSRDRSTAATDREVPRVRGLWPLPLLVAVIVGGMFSGILTPTEAGAAAAFGAVILALCTQRGRGAWLTVKEAATETVRTVGAIFLILLGALIFARLLTVTGIARGFSSWVIGLDLGRTEFLLLMVVVYLVLGMFLDPLSMMLVTVPLLVPTLQQIDVPLLWFGVFAVLMGELAIITPPVGILSYVLHGIVKEPDVNQGNDISLNDVFRAVLWFLPLTLVIVLVLILVPDIAMFLPNLMQ